MKKLPPELVIKCTPQGVSFVQSEIILMRLLEELGIVSDMQTIRESMQGYSRGKDNTSQVYFTAGYATGAAYNILQKLGQTI